MNRHHLQPRNHDESPERGAALVEYALMLSLVLLVALAGVSAFGGTLSENVDESASRIVVAGDDLGD